MMINSIEIPSVKGERIQKICTNYSYVDLTAPIHSLAVELRETKIPAIAVLTEQRKLAGIIDTKKLFEMLSKPYGRDLLFRKTAKEIMRKPRTFLNDEHISDVHEHVNEDFFLSDIQNYALVDAKKNFTGLFSSKDLLLHIASMQQQETIITASIQKRIIPPFISYCNKGLSIVGASFMAQRVGGDYYFVKQLDDQKTFFCLCDISGKGMSAALIASVLAGFMEAITVIKDLTVTIQKLNTLILETFSLEKYLTGIFCIYNNEDNSLEYCDMGHGLFFEICDKGIVQLQENSDNMPIGVANLDTILKQTIIPNSQTVYAIMTDGITEQKNEEGKLFSLNELHKKYIENTTELKKIKITFFESFFLFKKNTVQMDDASILLFSIKKAP